MQTTCRGRVEDVSFSPNIEVQLFFWILSNKTVKNPFDGEELDPPVKGGRQRSMGGPNFIKGGLVAFPRRRLRVRAVLNRGEWLGGS